MPVKVNIKETNFDFGALSERRYTDMIVIHHTGSVKNVDFSAAKIHEMHLDKGWAGIGYHFVIRKDGSIERGRPIWAVGAHAGENGMNSHSIGIHLSGDFNAAYPTDKQIEMTSMLIAYLCDKYNISIDRQHIKGHCEVGSTDCPGKNLFSLLDTLSGKAIWYHNSAQINELQAKNSSQSISEIPIGAKPDAVVKTVIVIRSDSPISEETLKMVSDIFKESLCPNESMLNSIPNFKSFNNNGVMIIGNDGNHTARIEF